MKFTRRFCISAMVFAAATVIAAAQEKGKGMPMPGFTLTTASFQDGGEIPPKYTQSSPNPISPSLAWSHVPANTAAFVLIMHDPEAVDNKMTEDHLHWMLLNIPATVHELPEGVPATPTLGDGTIQCKNVGGTVGYRGPGAGAQGPHHHYTLEMFALDTKLGLGPDATRSDVLKAMEGHILGKAVVVGRFHR
jgi:Raf kinase inhibitor-like YbhB/YbcL family protein